MQGGEQKRLSGKRERGPQGRWITRQCATALRSRDGKTAGKKAAAHTRTGATGAEPTNRALISTEFHFTRPASNRGLDWRGI